ncbi:MAG: hypothetical protein GY822_32835, partial [Deltaproteobacteria bacterium]|nr:hypothetical protein [Deltaproteobacteria bacterium]
NLFFRGATHRGAANGTSGTLLLDPKNIEIVEAGGDDGELGDKAIDFDDDIGDENFTISASTLAEELTSGGDVTLQANNDITFSSDVTSAQALGEDLGNNLTLQAGRSIIIGDGVTIELNGSDFTATINDSEATATYRDDGPAVFTMSSGSSIITNGGAITIESGGLLNIDGVIEVG